MNRSTRFELSLAFLAGMVVLVSCFSNTPAIPPAKESPKNVQALPVSPQPSPRDSQKVDDFTANVRPILGKCQPCHFQGGKVYAKLPFDNPKTIRDLGVKLFTRIRDEKEQAIIRTFLAQSADSTKVLPRH